MKLAIRILALSVVFIGAAAASLSSATNHAIPSHQAATSSMPAPVSGMPVPSCNPVICEAQLPSVPGQ
jgi:hypothetical protein